MWTPSVPSVFIKVFQCSLYSKHSLGKTLFVCLSARNVDTWIRCILLQIRFWKLSICAPGTSARNPRVCRGIDRCLGVQLLHPYTPFAIHFSTQASPLWQRVATVCRITRSCRYTTNIADVTYWFRSSGKMCKLLNPVVHCQIYVIHATFFCQRDSSCTCSCMITQPYDPTQVM